MAVTYVGTSAAVTGTTASLAPTWPTGYLTDDLGIIIFETSGNSTAAHTPAGWTRVTGLPISELATIAGSRLHILYRFATSAAEGAIAMGAATDHGLVRMMAFRGVSKANPFDAIATSIKATTSTTQTGPSVTTTVADCCIVSVATRPNDTTSTTTFGPYVCAGLTGLVDVGEAGTNSGNGGGFALDYGFKTTAGPTGTGTRTLSLTVTNVNATLALTPEPPPAPGTIIVSTRKPVLVTTATQTATTASFTADAGDLIIAHMIYNGGATATSYSPVITDSQSQTWTVVRQIDNLTNGGGKAGVLVAWTRAVTTVARTVTATYAMLPSNPSPRVILDVECLEGVTVPPIALASVTSLHDTSGTFSASLTTTTIGSQTFCAVGDWDAGVVPTAGPGCALLGGYQGTTSMTGSVFTRLAEQQNIGSVETITNTAPTSTSWTIVIYEARPGDPTPPFAPPTPTGVVTSPSFTSVNVTWPDVDTAESYEVEVVEGTAPGAAARIRSIPVLPVALSHSSTW